MRPIVAVVGLLLVFAACAFTGELRAGQAGQAPEAGSIATGMATNRRPMRGVPVSCPQPVTVQSSVFR